MFSALVRESGNFLYSLKNKTPFEYFSDQTGLNKLLFSDQKVLIIIRRQSSRENSSFFLFVPGCTDCLINRYPTKYNFL